ncbi:bifunctional 4-hydroxy-2-oxoglutarate aldolase/2-dehydro-3-deoxy-phosphogluconate aldolase [Thermoflexibacter ruber]|uniref:2-dehydro-3-deoxyphosphogluconate aldolase / (4S)-4-hydroxy-2-oxoglutarate aldolase n=1 Tax=Thermoflexibacter ruber TaxID=1003 RepID=A0A1I2BRQ7_9BACT|nr:bifunctional 4-hydroxy-2-oxoglutarate aldolase/2-dehydro-3-deoxy-phosphogluconate aldolase [Thermoflexibacter ruber]SFE57993.1 2-dehydro-3-deoxyphosphogluconate aldolase / (4S)-4-hydroxy-2-oxoglutarate aldolase [Thermoflexibacter ruber]
MARFRRIDVFLKMEATGIIPVFYHPDIEVCKGVLQACYQGGIRIFEFTNRDDFAHEVFAELSKYATKNFPEMIMGVGTIMDASTAALYIQLGANFVVSPILHPETAYTCNRRKILWIPGCATLSEISKAEELGAEVVKVFPGEVFKPSFVKALKAPMPWTNVMVTGGVSPTQESIEEWFGAGVSCVGMGSQLFPKEVLQRKDFQFIEDKVKTAIGILQAWRVQHTK